MLRHVLVCLDDRRTGEMGRDAAIRFANGYGASLTGLLVREPSPERTPPMVGLAPRTLLPVSASVALDDLARAHDRREDERESAILHAFRETCHLRSLTPAWRVVTGEPAAVIPLQARAVDLVVAGRGEKGEGRIGSVAISLVRRLVCPVLLASSELGPISKIAVAYDGSHGADRALAVAADIAHHWKGEDVSIVLIAVGSPEEHVREALVDAERYLDVYHLAHRSHVLDGPAAELIVDAANRECADFLLMGAFGHTRLHEMFAGSTTRSVIEHWKGGLLLCH